MPEIISQESFLESHFNLGEQWGNSTQLFRRNFDFEDRMGTNMSISRQKHPSKQKYEQYVEQLGSDFTVFKFTRDIEDQKRAFEDKRRSYLRETGMEDNDYTVTSRHPR